MSTIPSIRPRPGSTVAGALLAVAIGSATAASQPTFDVDVMAVLSKAGCNAGTCHGNLNGKGGFRLSLRGQDPLDDYRAIVGELGGRRIDRLQPARSLLLLKPTGQVAHQGGRRFSAESALADIVREWVAAGAPPPAAEHPAVTGLQVEPRDRIVFAPQRQVSLRVRAMFSDGTCRDVTEMAVYEPSDVRVSVSPAGTAACQEPCEATISIRYLTEQEPVRVTFAPARPDFQWSEPAEHNFVDRHIFARLKRLRVNPAPPCSDQVFLRRAHLDVLGLPPTADEAREFVADCNPLKRQHVIDQLLARPELADQWALRWSDVLRNEEKVLDATGVDTFYGWIRQAFEEARPLDAFARQLVSARGSTYEHAPANFYRALRDPNTRGEAVARVFLGTRLQCAQCHNHPFDRWTQNDYYAWAALFARIDYEIVDNERKDRLDKNEFVGEQIVQIQDKGEVTHPDTGERVPPRFLGEASTLPGDTDRLEQLAAWLTSADNEAFAQSQVNRIWYHLMGRGLVEPVDDFRETNPASHPGLLKELARDFVAHGCDVRHTMRVIMQSASYQLAAATDEASATDDAHYARAIVRRLTAEQLLDAYAHVLGVPARFNGYPAGVRAGQLHGVQRVRLRDQPPSSGDRFLTTFGKPQRLIACDCERSEQTTLSQALLLISGQGLHRMLTDQDNLLAGLCRPDSPPAAIARELYWMALTRPPTAEELAVAEDLLRQPDDRQQSLQDLAWALLNAKEFVFRY
jgi:hypothetical protein